MSGEKKTAVSSRKISFKSKGIDMAGMLYSPIEKADDELPLIIIDPSWTNVKEQFAALYAERLAERCYHTLTFDFRYYGESGGTPRNYEAPFDKIEDLKSALLFAETLPQVNKNKIYLLGICAGAGHAAIAAIKNSRVKKLALVASWLHDGEGVKIFYGGAEGVADKIRKGKEAKKKYDETGLVEYAPKASKSDNSAAMFGDFSYYLDTKRGLIPQWQIEEFAVMSWEPWLSFDAHPYAAQIGCPLLMIHSKEAALPDHAKKFFDAVVATPKTIYWTNGIQFDFYDGERVNEVIDQLEFFFDH